jgi:putative peptide zinc metalloprotease protein
MTPAENEKEIRLSVAEAPTAAELPPIARPLVVAGTSLAGEYTDSGFKEPSFLARRADGQVVQLSRLLYLIAEASDGSSDCHAIAESVSDRFGRSVSASNVAYLCQRKLIPLGVLTTEAAAPVTRVRAAPAATPLLGLKFRVALVPEGVVRAVARVLGPLFSPPVVAAALAGLAYFDFWLWGHGLNSALVQIITHPALMLMLLGCVVASGVFHELGHATACQVGGAKPGPIGAGLYLVMPALYSDVTDSYRLPRAGRVRTDLGGVYFNAVTVLVAAGAYSFCHFEPLLLAALLIQFEIVEQFIPFIRLDGYWVISDLIGIPDLFGRIRPILLSVLPRFRHDPRVTELRTRARIVVTAWVCTTLPVLGFNLFLLLRNAPRVAGLTLRTASSEAGVIGVAARSHQGLTVACAAVSMVLVVLPLIAMGLTATWTFHRLGAATYERVAARIES